MLKPLGFSSGFFVKQTVENQYKFQYSQLNARKGRAFFTTTSE